MNGGVGEMSRMGGGLRGYRTPASLRAFCRIVSFTAAKTRRILLVSVACVKLQIRREQQRSYCGYTIISDRCFI